MFQPKTLLDHDLIASMHGQVTGNSYLHTESEPHTRAYLSPR